MSEKRMLDETHSDIRDNGISERKFNLEVMGSDGKWRPIAWRDGHGMCCPNWRNCHETSLSVSWHINMRDDISDPNLYCFQCGTVIARLA